MDKYKIVKRIESFAPSETQEDWDASGWVVETDNKNINKIMLCLTLTEDIVNQARSNSCDMIISHHPLFCVPLGWRDIDIYCAHTNFDKAQGGTTDTLVETLFSSPDVRGIESEGASFIRYLDINISVSELLLKLRKISPNLRYVNNNNVEELNRIAFCAGSGSEFIEEAVNYGANALVTGDIKFHTAIESPIVLFDIGHFESEILSLKVFKDLVGDCAETLFAKETSPFKY